MYLRTCAYAGKVDQDRDEVTVTLHPAYTKNRQMVVLLSVWYPNVTKCV